MMYFKWNFRKQIFQLFACLFFFTLISCNAEQNGLVNGFLNSTTIKEIKWGNIVPSDIKTFRSIVSVDYVAAIPHLGYSGFFITTKYSKNKFKDLEAGYKKESLYECDFKGYCHCENKGVFSVEVNDSLNIKLIPDVFFDKKRFFIKDHRISEESDIYVMSFNKGDFLQKEDRIDIKNTYYNMHDKKYNQYGYSVGVFVDEENLRITHWLILW